MNTFRKTTTEIFQFLEFEKKIKSLKIDIVGTFVSFTYEGGGYSVVIDSCEPDTLNAGLNSFYEQLIKS
jgi:hypothetical protein